MSDYLAWFRWLEHFKSDKDIIKIRNRLVHSHTAYTTTKSNEFVSRGFNFKNTLKLLIVAKIKRGHPLFIVLFDLSVM